MPWKGNFWGDVNRVPDCSLTEGSWLLSKTDIACWLLRQLLIENRIYAFASMLFSTIWQIGCYFHTRLSGALSIALIIESELPFYFISFLFPEGDKSVKAGANKVLHLSPRSCSPDTNWWGGDLFGVFNTLVISSFLQKLCDDNILNQTSVLFLWRAHVSSKEGKKCLVTHESKSSGSRDGKKNNLSCVSSKCSRKNFVWNKSSCQILCGKRSWI